MTSARDFYHRAGWTIGFALILYFINHNEYPGPAATLSGVIVLIGLAFVAAGYFVNWLNTVGQQRVRQQILDAAQINGSERVLDMGGAMGIPAGKVMKSGKVIAVGDLNLNEALREQSRNEGLTDKVRFESGDLKKLSYPNANFDIVLSSRGLELLGDEATMQAAAEIARVLKPGGRAVIHAIGDSGHYIKALPAAGFASPSPASTGLPFGLGGHIFTVSKS